MKDMSIDEYTKRYREIKKATAMGMLTYEERIKEHNKLNREYLKGKGSHLLPVVL